MAPRRFMVGNLASSSLRIDCLQSVSQRVKSAPGSMKDAPPANHPRWSQHNPMGVASLGTSASSAPDLANKLAPAQVGRLTPILQEILHRHQHLGLRLQVQLQGWEGGVRSVRAGLALGRLRARPMALPQGQGGSPIAWPDTCLARVGRAPPKPRPTLHPGYYYIWGSERIQSTPC